MVMGGVSTYCEGAQQTSPDEPNNELLRFSISQLPDYPSLTVMVVADLIVKNAKTTLGLGQ